MTVRVASYLSALVAVACLGTPAMAQGDDLALFHHRKEALVAVLGCSAREVEDVCRTVGGIADVAVVGRKHPMLDQVAVAFVIRTPDEKRSEAEHAEAILAACRAKLADFKVPRAVWFRDEFPTATLEKVAKNRLRELADEMPDPS